MIIAALRSRTFYVRMIRTIQRVLIPWKRIEPERSHVGLRLTPTILEAIEDINVALLYELSLLSGLRLKRATTEFAKSRFVFKTQDQYLYVHEVYKHLSSGQNKGNASMLVLGMLLGDDGARCVIWGD